MRRMRSTTTVVLVAAMSFVAACSGTASTGGHRGGSGRAPVQHQVTTIPAVANPTTGPSGPLGSAGGPFLADRYGRVVLMHGADLVYKVPPFEVVVDGTGPNVLTPPEAQRMAGLGFDVVRLGIIWKGLEPGTAPINDPAICSPGPLGRRDPEQFNPSVFNGYLRALDATISLLGRYGIYSLIDMHQDVYNEVFGGEGAPNWAVCTDGVKPKPELNVPNWSINLQGPGVVTAYSHFWDNNVVGDLQGEFDAVWTKVAAHFRRQSLGHRLRPLQRAIRSGPSSRGRRRTVRRGAAVLLRGSCPSRDGSVREADHVSGG